MWLAAGWGFYSECYCIMQQLTAFHHGLSMGRGARERVFHVKKRAKVAGYFSLALVMAFILLAVIDTLFASYLGSTWEGSVHRFYVATVEMFIFLFYKQLANFFVWNLLVHFLSVPVYSIAYSAAKKHRVGSMIFVYGCVVLWVVQFLSTIAWTFFALVGNPGWSVEVKLILTMAFFPMFLVFMFFLDIGCDLATFMGDFIKDRGEYNKITYKVEVDGKRKIIYFDTSKSRINSTINALIFVMIDQVLWEQGDAGAGSRFLKSTLMNIFAEIATHFNFWPKFKNGLFKMVGVKLGRATLISQYTRVDHMLPNLVILEDYAQVALSCNLITHTFIDRDTRRAFLYGPVRICSYARVAASVTITPGVTIGEGAVVAANSLVNEDVAPYTLVGGTPAKVIKKLDPASYAERIEKDKKLDGHTEAQ
jgi:acetyltransferase-like isoleucine patch superfamily enzyme